MNITQLILIIVLSSSGFTGLVYFILKRWFQKQLDKNLETHKGEVSKGLETHKGEIKKALDVQLESYKGGIQEKLEILKDSYIKENLESTRFVEVICRQRIEWLEQVRNDVAFILANTDLYFSTISGNAAATLIDLFSKGYDMVKKNDIDSAKIEELTKNIRAKSQENVSIKSELLRVIGRLKLRLNFEKDVGLIQDLDKLKELVESDQNHALSAVGILKSITSESQQILKKEWDRVKQEVQKGEEIEKLKSQKRSPINLGKVNKPLIDTLQNQ